MNGIKLTQRKNEELIASLREQQTIYDEEINKCRLDISNMLKEISKLKRENKVRWFNEQEYNLGKLIIIHKPEFNKNKNIEYWKELKKKIKEKNEKIEQLMKGEKPEVIDKDLKDKCSDLENENNNLRNQVLAFEQKIKEQQMQSIDLKLNEFRNSLAGYGEDYNFAFEDLKNHLDKETRQNLNEIIKNKRNRRNQNTKFK